MTTYSAMAWWVNKDLVTCMLEGGYKFFSSFQILMCRFFYTEICSSGERNLSGRWWRRSPSLAGQKITRILGAARFHVWNIGAVMRMLVSKRIRLINIFVDILKPYLQLKESWMINTVTAKQYYELMKRLNEVPFWFRSNVFPDLEKIHCDYLTRLFRQC